MEVAILLLYNDKNNVTAKNVWSYLQCLSSKFEVSVTRYRAKQWLLIFCYEMQIY